MELASGVNSMELASGVNSMELASGDNGMELASGANSMKLASGANSMEHGSQQFVVSLPSLDPLCHSLGLDADWLKQHFSHVYI
jgi:hypothetical protein